MKKRGGMLQEEHDPRTGGVYWGEGARAVAAHYRAALGEEFRFLSFGDSSLFLPGPLFSHARREAAAAHEAAP